ncbi:MAG: heavy metal translocating P-type ATPase metal-binding domain-containing protein [Cyclobacteriaceae bacterium]
MELLKAEELACHHCGDPCDETIVTDEYTFCCYGCRAVYELLESSQLNKFYKETSQTNTSFSGLKSERKFSFLDNPDVQNQLLKFRSEELSVIKFSIPSIHCSSCIYLLEHLPKLDHSVLRSEVNFVRKEITISFRHTEKSLKQIAILLSQLGYPPDISLNDLDKTGKEVVRSRTGLKIAVAGFCFGNAMLMSMPEYLDTNFQLTENFIQLFRWINLVLTFPVVFFSGSDYFKKAWKGLVHGNLNIDVPIALGITTLFGRTLFEIISQTGPGYADSLAGLVFLLLIGKWYQGKSYQALSFDRDYTSYFPVSVTCLIDEQEVSRSLKELRKGDIVIIHNDELIPADGKIISGEGNIDYSFVTGESKPDEKSKGQKVFAGGRQKGCELIIELTERVNNSELTQLWNNEAFRKNETGLANRIDSISKYFTLVVLITALATGVYWWFANPALVWNSVTAVLIVACPCALALTLPFAYGHAMRLLGKNGLYLKKAEIIEPLSRIESVVFDKTGTLTTNSAGVNYMGDPLTKVESALLKSALGNSSHPLSRQIHNNLPECEKVPLTFFREETGKGFNAIINGKEIKVGSAEFLGFSSDNKLNESRVYVNIDGSEGFFAVKSDYRKGIFDMLNKLKNNYRLQLLSGDNDSEKEHLKPFFDELRFNQRPADKLGFLSGKEQNQLMIGDGLNDAGALKKALAGIAISEDIHQFSPACDAIMSANSITLIPAVLRFSKKVRKIVFVAFGISFLYNIIGLSFAVSGHLTPLISAILMPVSSVTVVGFVTLMVIWHGKMPRSEITPK